MLTALIILSTSLIIAFVIYWTYYRFVKIARKNLKDYHKKLWWGLMISSVVSFLALVIVYFTTR